MKIGNIFGHTGGSFAGNVYDVCSLAPTINTMQGGNTQPMIIESAKVVGVIDKGTGKHQSNVVYDENALCPTITTMYGETKIYDENNYRVRKLTPRECWRLMGFDDDAFDKAASVNSNTQLYKQAILLL